MLFLLCFMKLRWVLRMEQRLHSGNTRLWRREHLQIDRLCASLHPDLHRQKPTRVRVRPGELQPQLPRLSLEGGRRHLSAQGAKDLRELAGITRAVSAA